MHDALDGFGAGLTSAAQASEDIADKYPGSMLYDKPVEFIPGVFSAIGATAPPTYENAGHNNNLSFIVTGDGVVVINGGAAYGSGARPARRDQGDHGPAGETRFQRERTGARNARQQLLGGIGRRSWPMWTQRQEVEAYGGSILEEMKRYNRDKAEGTVVQGPP